MPPRTEPACSWQRPEAGPRSAAPRRRPPPRHRRHTSGGEPWFGPAFFACLRRPLGSGTRSSAATPKQFSSFSSPVCRGASAAPSPSRRITESVLIITLGHIAHPGRAGKSGVLNAYGPFPFDWDRQRSTPSSASSAVSPARSRMPATLSSCCRLVRSRWPRRSSSGEMSPWKSAESLRPGKASYPAARSSEPSRAHSTRRLMSDRWRLPGWPVRIRRQRGRRSRPAIA